jgi:hypothetical protein
MELTAEAVHKIFEKCLLKTEEVSADHKPLVPIVEIEGVVHNFGLSKQRLSENKDDIIKLLAELPEQFHEETGGGWSFLNGCMDKNGHQWGEQPTVEQLLVLGIGIEKVRYCLPRELWNMLPGGVPMFVVMK